MAVQTISRQALLNKLTSVINQLPEDRLQQAWEQIETWETMASVHEQNGGGRRATADDEILEFDVGSQQVRHTHSRRLPIRATGPVTKAVMTVREEVDMSRFTQQLQANVEWWNQHYAVLCNDVSLHGRYVAVSNGELFSGETYRAAYNMACAVQADAVPYIFFLKTQNRGVCESERSINTT